MFDRPTWEERDSERLLERVSVGRQEGEHGHSLLSEQIPQSLDLVTTVSRDASLIEDTRGEVKYSFALNHGQYGLSPATRLADRRVVRG